MSRLSVELHPVSYRLAAPLRTAAGSYQDRPGVLVVVRAGPHLGAGEATPLEPFGTESYDAALAALTRAASALDGLAAPRDLEDAERLVSDLGLARAPAASFGLETALLDSIGQQRGLPVASLLVRAPLVRAVRVNALLSAEDPAALFTQAKEAVSTGHRTLKVKVGGRPLAEDMERLRAVRSSAPLPVKLRIDANGAWPVDEAVEALTQLAQFQLELCEQPVKADDLEGLAAVRARTRTRIAADEAVTGEAAAKELLLRGAADVLVLKPMVLGSAQRAVTIAHQAARRGVESYVTSALEGPVGRLAALHVAAALGDHGLDHGLAVNGLFAESARPRSLDAVDGALTLPDGPGLGLSS